MNKEGVMDKWIVGLVPASLAVTYHTHRSSQRKEATYSVVTPGQEQVEPSHVGGYRIPTAAC
jgi:hypothetical protein